MVKITQMTGIDGLPVYPVSHTKAIYDENGKRLDAVLTELEHTVTELVPEINEARDEALNAIEEASSDVLKDLKVSPEMLSESTILLINASGGGTITNLPDDEDITSKDLGEGVSVLLFADKEYSEETFSGLGRTYLRKNPSGNKNILTLEMINKPNTVYHIQYAFDLNGAEITVPENCVLKFEGGSLSNGTLNGNNYEIEADELKIFYNIIFIGNSIYNLIFNVGWFCNNFYTEFVFNSDNYIDSSDELNIAFNCGVRNFIMPTNKFFYIKKPIIINGDIDIIGNIKQNKIQHKDYSDINKQIEPCIVTKEIDTMLIYHFNTDRQKKTLELSLKFANFSLFPTEIVDGITYSLLEKYDTPIIQFINESGMPLVRPVFDLTIIGKPGYKCYGLKYDNNTNKLIIDKRVNGASYQYTGISLEGPMYFAELRGYMQNIFQGFKLLNNDILDKNKNGFNCFRLNANLWTTLGGDFNHVGNPIIINGFYQSGGCFHVDEYNKLENAYFRNCSFTDGRNFNVNMQGFIYDLSLNTGNGFYITKNAFDTINISYPLDTEHISDIREELINTTRNSPIDKSTVYGYNNLLNSMYYTSRFVKLYKHILKFYEDDGSISEEDAIIFVDNETYISNYQNKYQETDKILHIITEDSYHLLIRRDSNRLSVQNTYKLFTNRLTCRGNGVDYDTSFIALKVDDVNAKRKVEQYIEFSLNEAGDSRFAIVSMNGTALSVNPIEVIKNGESFIQKIDSAPYYGDSIIKVPLSTRESFNCRVVTTSSYVTPLLRIIIPSDFISIALMNASNKDDMADRAYGTYFGFNLLNKRPIYKMHESIYEFDGEYFGIKRTGTKQYRPGIYGKNPNNIGFSFFDETLKRFIYWQGDKYVDYDGESVEINRNGTFAQKPLSSTGIKVGFEYFCTDKKSPESSEPGLTIYHKGNDIWTDSLGRIVDDNYPVLTKGTTEQRPTLTETDDGFEYYDSDLKKKILWDGTEWTNLDGTPLA